MTTWQEDPTLESKDAKLSLIENLIQEVKDNEEALPKIIDVLVHKIKPILNPGESRSEI